MSNYRVILLALVAAYCANAQIATPETQRAIELNNRGLALGDAHNYAAAEPLYREAAEILRKAGPEFQGHLSVELYNLAESMCGQGKWTQGAKVFDESLEISRRSLGVRNSATIGTMNALGNTRMLLGDTAGAESLFQEALTLERELYPASVNLARTLAGLSALRTGAGQPDEGLPMGEEALSIMLKTKGDASPETAMIYQTLAQAHRAAKRNERAWPLLRKAEAILERAAGTEDPRYATILSQEGLMLMEDGRLLMAERNMKRAMETLRDCGRCKLELAVAQHNLGLLRIRQKKFSEADALLTKALTLEETTAPQGSMQAQATRKALIDLHSTAIGR